MPALSLPTAALKNGQEDNLETYNKGYKKIAGRAP